MISNHMLLSFSHSALHGGQPIGQLTAYALAHMGPAKSNIQYNPDAGLEAYTNSSVHTRLIAYTEAARSVNGPGYDPRTEECLDPQLVMRVGARQEAWAVLAWRRRPRHELCSSSQPPSSSKHEL
jgi:hypothetical protein